MTGNIGMKTILYLVQQSSIPNKRIAVHVCTFKLYKNKSAELMYFFVLNFFSTNMKTIVIVLPNIGEGKRLGLCDASP